MDESEMTFSAQEAVAVQRELRRSLGLGPEAFPLPAFVGMISDEIDQFRAAGRSDAEIAERIKATVGREVSPAAIQRFHGPGRSPAGRRPRVSGTPAARRIPPPR